MMEVYVRTPTLDNGDHKFALFLRKNGWTGDTATTRDMVKYIHPNGDPIVIAVYDNKECTYEVYVAKGFANG
jgi:hypothetical protein